MNRSFSVGILCLVVLAVAACSSPVRRIEINSTPVVISYKIIKHPQPMQLNKLPKFITVVPMVEINKIILMIQKNKELSAKNKKLLLFWKDLKKNMGKGVVFFAMRTKSYENLARNTAEFRRYIKDLQASITYYEKLLIKEKPVKSKRWFDWR